MKGSMVFLILIFSLSTQMIWGQNAPVSTVGNEVTTGLVATVPITATGFTNIGSCNMQLLYDPAVVTCTGITMGPGIPANISSNINTPGVITWGWYTWPGVTKPDNSVIFNLSFAKVASGTSNITWNDSYGDRQWSDGNSIVLNDLPLANYYFPGSITFQGDAPITTAPHLLACPGDIIDVPVTVESFNTIGAVSLTMLFNSSVLTYLSFTNNSGFPGLSVLNPSDGNLTMAGFDPTAGKTLADDAILFTLHFDYTGGYSGFDWSDDGTTCEYAGPFPDYPVLNDLPEDTYYIDGSVGPRGDAPLTTAPDMLACPGDLIDVPVTVASFNNIGKLSLEMLFESSALTYSSFTNNSGFTGLLVANPSTGRITIEGLDPTTGITLPDDAVLFTLHFNYLGGGSGFDWRDDGTSCEYTGLGPDYNVLCDSPQLDYYINGSVSQQCTNVALGIMLEGLYNPVSEQMNQAMEWNGTALVSKYLDPVVDMITVELHDPNNYANIVLTKDNIALHRDGTVNFEISPIYNGEYWVTIKNRNHLESVTLNKVDFSSYNVNIQYSTNSPQVYGNNQKQMSTGIYAIYAGDIDLDGDVDINDAGPINSAIISGAIGYLPEDINGDGYIDINDIGPVNTNIINSVVKITPP
jgi:hypothetical protein